jgi:hypothetical protein
VLSTASVAPSYKSFPRPLAPSKGPVFDLFGDAHDYPTLLFFHAGIKEKPMVTTLLFLDTPCQTLRVTT